MSIRWRVLDLLEPPGSKGEIRIRDENRVKCIQINALRWAYLALGALGLLFVGVIFAWSILKAPLAESTGWSSNQLAFNYTLTISFFCIGSIVAGNLLKRLGVRMLLLAGSVLVAAGFCACSQLSGGSPLKLYILYGILIGGGVGLSYNSLLSTVGAWFPDRKGTCSGIMMMCFGLSTLLIGKAAAALFLQPGYGWRYAYTAIGISTGLILFICALLLKLPSPSVQLPSAHGAVRGKENHPPKDFSSSEMIRRGSFWLYYIYGIFTASVGGTVFSFAVDLSLSVGASASLATTMVGIMSVSNGFGRVLCGVSFDVLGRRITMFLANCITIFSPALMLAALRLSSIPVAAAALALTGLSFGSCPTIGAALIGSFYGMRDYPMNFSISNSKLLFSSFTASISSVLLSRTDSYTSPFILLLVLASLAFIMSLFIRRP